MPDLDAKRRNLLLLPDYQAVGLFRAILHKLYVSSNWLCVRLEIKVKLNRHQTRLAILCTVVTTVIDLVID
jgi:hypothetical protein